MTNAGQYAATLQIATSWEIYIQQLDATIDTAWILHLKHTGQYDTPKTDLKFDIKVDNAKRKDLRFLEVKPGYFVMIFFGNRPDYVWASNMGRLVLVGVLTPQDPENAGKKHITSEAGTE